MNGRQKRKVSTVQVNGMSRIHRAKIPPVAAMGTFIRFACVCVITPTVFQLGHIVLLMVRSDDLENDATVDFRPIPRTG